MNLIDFIKTYPDEQSCKDKFRQIRENQGVICKKCQHTEHYWKKDKECFECKKCKFRTYLKAGTVMENSKLPFRDWFLAMHLMTATKKSFSAKELQRQLGRKRYEPVWTMMHKIRSVMGLRDDEYQLKDSVEIDEGFFETVNQLGLEATAKKRGRGSQKQTKVLVMTQSKEVSDEKHQKGKPKKKVGFLKMKVIQSLKSEVINQKIEKGIEQGTDTLSDNYSSYSKITDKVNHTKEKVTKDNLPKILPWVHIAISNAKRLLLDVFHRIDADFLENYLNEFCYKFNRRYFKTGLFDRLLVASVKHRWNELG